MSTDAIDVDMDLYSEPPRDRVRFRLENIYGEAVGIRLQQPIGSDIPQSQVTVDAEYETQSWQTSEDSLVFIEKLEAGQTVKTGYDIGGVDTSTIRELVRDVTIEVRDLDGVDLGSLKGTDLYDRGQKLGPDHQPDQPGETDTQSSVSDYVLKDVEEVEPSEFAWTPVEAHDEESDGLLRWQWLVYLVLIVLIVTITAVFLVRPEILTNLL